MDNTALLGMIAAILTSVSFIPQALQIIRTKDTRSISLPMYILFFSGIFLWLIYGYLLDSVPMLFANTVTLIFSGIILFYKIRDVRREKFS